MWSRPDLPWRTPSPVSEPRTTGPPGSDPRQGSEALNTSEVRWVVVTGTDEAWGTREHDLGSLRHQAVILQLLGHGGHPGDPGRGPRAVDGASESSEIY